MRGDTLHVDQLHVMTFKERSQWFYRVITEMLMIDRVEQRLFEHIKQIGNFEDERSILRQQSFYRLNKAVKIVDVSKYVIRSDYCRRTAIPSDGLRQFPVEKSRNRFDSGRIGPFGDQGSRFDTQDAAALIFEKPQ